MYQRNCICKVNKRIFLIMALLVCAFKMNAQMMVIKSDLLRDVATMPNVHIDCVVGEKHSLGVGGGYCYKMWGKDIQIASFSPNFRYWFNGRPFTRQYVGVKAQISQYDITWRNSVYDGASLAVGMIFGHVFNLGKRLNLELEGGLDALGYTQKEYYKSDIYDDYGDMNNSRGVMMCPHLSFSISYILK